MSKIGFAALVRNARSLAAALAQHARKEWVEWQVAKQAADAARDALKEAILAAEWGPHGSAFVADQAENTGSTSRIRILYLNRRPVATVNTGEKKRPWIELISPEEGERQYEEWRQMCRQNARDERQERELLIADLVATRHLKARSIGCWTFCEGQKGGFFYREGGAAGVAARGALREAERLLKQSDAEMATLRRYNSTRY